MQFLQANASWIIFGIALLFMFWMHSGRGHSMGGSGGGCGMGHQHEESQQPEGAHEHGRDRSPGLKPVEPPVETWGSGKRETATPVGAGSSNQRHGGGCH